MAPIDVHDDSPELARVEAHEFRVGDRVEVVEGTRTWEQGHVAGVVVFVGPSVAEFFRAIGWDRHVIPELWERLDDQLAEEQHWPLVRFDDVTAGTEGMLPDGARPIQPSHLIRVE